MNKFDNLKSKNIDEFTEWLDEYCYHDNAPWMTWFDNNYCKKCEGIPNESFSWIEYAYCEKYKKCRFLPEMDEAPNCKQIVKMWLESEINNVD